MKAKEKKYWCVEADCFKPIENWETGLCATHAREARKKAAPKAKPARKRIAKVSEEGKERMAIYNAIKESWLCSHRFCGTDELHWRMWPLDHSEYATEVHHQRGRIGDLLYDVRYWMPVCRKCHQYIETHPEEAYEKGWSLLRNANEPHEI